MSAHREAVRQLSSAQLVPSELLLFLLQVRYWKTNLELVKSVSAHREAVRQLSFAPSDLKYATGSDDSTIRVRMIEVD